MTKLAPKLPSKLTLTQLQQVGGDVQLPGSKSISNRALLLAALAEGTTELYNLLASDDTRYMQQALSELGVGLELGLGNTCTVQGVGGPLTPSGAGNSSRTVDSSTVDSRTAEPLELYLGMAGTAYRPLTAALCLSQGRYDLVGNKRMSERPIGHLVDGLRLLGANIDYLGETNFPPLRVTGTGLTGGQITMRGDISSQFLTSLLLSAPLARDVVQVTIEGELVSKPYLDITVALMQSFGARVEHQNYEVFTVQPGNYRAVDSYLIEGDASNASYFLAAGAISGSGVTVHGLGRDSVQGDLAFTEVLRAMGAEIDVGERAVSVKPATLKAIDMDLNHIPDAAMTAAVLALFADGTTHLRNLYNLRVKETDRLSALAIELRKVGASVVEGRDFLSITPPEFWVSARIDTYDDHRMAMCFSLLALKGVPVTINDPKCVAKTFPNFFTEFAKIGAQAVS